jgi:hypothetical protein
VKGLIRDDAKQHLVENGENGTFIKNKALLINKTALPDNTACTDSCVVNAIRDLGEYGQTPGQQCPLENCLRTTRAGAGRSEETNIRGIST